MTVKPFAFALMALLYRTIKSFKRLFFACSPYFTKCPIGIRSKFTSKNSDIFKQKKK